MENATKALLIAGSVLIAIVLIAVGLKILNSTSGVTKQVDDLSTTMEKSMFNSQYTQYAGQQTGTVVKEIINKVKTYNATVTGDGKKIKFKTIPTSSNGLTPHNYDSQESSLNDILDKINVNYTYKVEVILKDGLVDLIKIE